MKFLYGSTSRIDADRTVAVIPINEIAVAHNAITIVNQIQFCLRWEYKIVAGIQIAAEDKNMMHRILKVYGPKGRLGRNNAFVFLNVAKYKNVR